jgi:hypothetical protein
MRRRGGRGAEVVAAEAEPAMFAVGPRRRGRMKELTFTVLVEGAAHLIGAIIGAIFDSL